MVDCMKLFAYYCVYGFLAYVLLCQLCHAKYDPTWDSLDARPLPSWYDEAKLGIFIHWGVFSVPSFRNEWFWNMWKTGDLSINEFMLQNYKPNFTYQDFAKSFTAEFFYPDHWADIFNSSGAKYVVFVSKHHEGYCNYPSKYSFSWNSMDVGPNRDIVGELAESIRKRTSMKFGVYHSQFEWFNPLWLQDKANNFTTQDFVNMKTLQELYELVEQYKPEILWSDGDWDAPSDYWKSKSFIAWLYNDSPVKDSVVINDRWGSECGCKHGGFYTCGDRYNPGHLVKHKWENAMTLDKYSWGYRREAKLEDYLTVEEFLTTFIQTVSCGGNMLVNVGPRHDGIIDTIMVERLTQIGQWLGVNGEAIYGTQPWIYQNDTANPNVWYTKKTINSQTVVYAIVLAWPANGTVYLGSPSPSPTSTVVSLVGMAGKLTFKPAGAQGMWVMLPPVSPSTLPCQWAWVLRLEGLMQKPKKEKEFFYRINVNTPHNRYNMPRPSVTYT